MALCVQENVLRLEVPVDDVLLMKSLDGTNDLSRVQFRPLLAELLLLAQIGEELATVEEVDEEVQLAISLERIVQANDVGVLDLLQNVSLSYSKGTKMKQLGDGWTVFDLP